ncbi:MAG: malonate decarboxylase holo-[acyl-carrier-protein] synthase [Comamonadaceae bacterium CG_4_9_14_0_8_um_filter_57_21]|nr:MAG: malonate decarboxylase holo-[acyl-carrier-protein] synthase [Comamonadaceae bacterium CG_4_10_14_0_8_um_filter_57_29]PJC16959.1 MAG: malonate decarboxylase holo-[acyl-carrier-protein] synthase [Comamonadaceae bacterium CG_4_9_14_0_8_um_filter_57_21]
MPLALINQAQSAIYFISNAGHLQRQQLVWLTDTAWQSMQARTWDATAHAVLAHWRAQQLPVVVTRQRGDAAPDVVCVGLPAPSQWGKRKLAFSVSMSDIANTSPCPTLAQVADGHNWQVAAMALNAALTQRGVQARVHGSFAWQQVTALAYLHPHSDLDLHLPVTSLAQASQVLDVLKQSSVSNLETAVPLPRLDGELIFPGGQAVAWRELGQLLSGQVAQVLVKDLLTVRLVDLADLRGLCKP